MLSSRLLMVYSKALLMKHIHILGICGTFMGSLAQLAKSLGFRVTGADVNVYPPMSTQLEQAGIELINGWGLEQLALAPDVFVVGNVVARGNPLMEAILDRMLPFTSGPEWLANHVLQERWVLAVAGTHGKTTTASMLAHILEDAKMDPGFLIGGVPRNFGVSARLGSTPFFVIEADEYDSAFFDKRSKFVHYRPNTLIMNNLEYDHADIFPDLAAIERQFHHLVRTVPSNGLLICPEQDAALQRVLTQGQWTPLQTTGERGAWQVRKCQQDGGVFDVWFEQAKVGQVAWTLTGQHNIDNALAALAAARHVGVEPHIGCEALSSFLSVKRRMEMIGDVDGFTVYDDFAHHPTAIKTTLAGLRAKVADAPIFAVIEPRSNTMKQGVHKETLLQSAEDADAVFWFESDNVGWSLKDQIGTSSKHYCDSSFSGFLEKIVSEALRIESKDVHIVVMSNGGFNGIHQKLIDALSS